MGIDAIEMRTRSAAVGSVIWMHGLGADGNDFASLIPALNLPRDIPINFIFPHAPVRPVTLNMGMKMRAWYDLIAISQDAREDKEGLEEARTIVSKLIENEVQRGIKEENILLAGFSQGGAVALYTGLRHPRPLKGILALSTYLPFVSELASLNHDKNSKPNILMMHGHHDDIVPITLALQSFQHLNAHGYPVEFKEYAMAHQVCPEQIADLSRYFTEVYR